MRIRTLFFIACLLLAGGILVGLLSWPTYKHQQQVASGQQAVELGAQLAFVENLYYERTGKFTADFSQLEPFLDAPVPCPLAASPYVCNGYEYTLQTPQWLLASSQKNPEIYVAFELKDGTVDCTHAPKALKSLPICSDL